MAILAPLAFAAVGGALTGGAMWAISAGWLIGSWLFGPKADSGNNIFDPGAEEMPRVNQSLRGATLSVLFGTNRVTSNIVWTKNFTTIRHETKDSAGGGKGGGSGMMKGGGGSTGEVTYEYKWDMMFHLGMGPEPYSIFGGWINTERMSDRMLDRIIQGDDAGQGHFRSKIKRKKSADMDFDESYFGFGGPSEDQGTAGGYDNWDYFEAQEGYPCRWPSTYYIGFKQLNLGNSARVPQMTWEIGPGKTTFTYNSAYKSNYKTSDLPTYGGVWENHVCDGTVMLKTLSGTTTDPTTGVKTAIGGKLLYTFTTVAVGHAFSLINALDGTVFLTYPTSRFQTDAAGLGLHDGGTYTYDQDICIIPVKGTEYFYVHGKDGLLVNESMHAVVLYRIEADDTITIVGGRCGRSNVTYHTLTDTTMQCFGRFGEDTNTDAILVCYSAVRSALRSPMVCYLPPTDEVENVNVITDYTTAYTWDLLFFGLYDSDQFDDHLWECNTYRTTPYTQRVFLLPEVKLDILSGAPIWYTWVVTYIGYPEIKKHTDLGNGATGNSPLVEAVRDGTVTISNQDDFDTAYPEAFFTAIRLGRHTITHAISPISLRADFGRKFIDDAGLAIIGRAGDTWYGWSDSRKNVDGTTATDVENDWMGPTVMNLAASQNAQGAFLILFPYKYTTQANLTPTGTHVKVRGFVWNPSTTIAKEYIEDAGSFADLVSDVGLSENNRYTNEPRGLLPYYDAATEKLYIFAAYKSSDPIADRFVVGEIGDVFIGGGTDVTPPFIIYTILTNTVFGFSYDPDRIDADSYRAAVAYCEQEEIRVSVQYNREDNMLSVIDELLTLYGGYLTESGGIIKFGQVTGSSSAVRTIDNHHLVIENEGDAPVVVTKGARQDGYNRVKVNFFNRDLEYRQDIVEMVDEVDMDLNGPRTKEFQPKFVMAPALAEKIAERALWTNLYAKDMYSFKLGWKDADLEPGDVITLQDSFHHELSTGIKARITRWVEKQRGVFDVMAVREVEYATTATRSYFDVKSVPGGNSVFNNFEPPLDFRMYELPQEFQGSDANLYVGYNQGAAAMGAHLYMSADNISYALVANAQPYIISGIFAEALPDREPGYVEEHIKIYLMPSSGFDPINSLTFAQTHTLDDVSESARAVGAGVLICGSEALAVEGLTLLSQNTYYVNKLYRGWGGTNIQDHSSGAYWHKHGGGMFVQAVNQDKVGTLVYYKVVPYNFAGQGYPVNSIDPKAYTITGAYWKPQGLPEAKMFISTPTLGTGSENTIDRLFRQVTSGGCDVTWTWPKASKVKGSGAGGYGKGGYGDFTADVGTPAYRIQVLSSDHSTVVRCTVVNTEFFTYARATNSADFNGAKGAFDIRITPYNAFGDAPFNREYRINLFW